MHKNDVTFIEDPNTNSKLTLSILLAYGIVMTGFLAVVGIIYLFSQMINKYSL
jgi:Tfp pilus assembly protein PilN